LELEYPDLRLGILATSTDPEDRSAMEWMLGHDYKGLALDFGTGAKKKGQFIVSDQQVAHRFWKTPEQAMAYGSNLLSTCIEPPHRGPMTVKVVEDGEAGTGDCHAKLCSLWAGMALGISRQAAQFRLVAGDYLAKGTALTYEQPTLLERADLIIPLSAFKSVRKPQLGTFQWQDVTWGTVAKSKKRQVKVSYQVLQWFSKAAIQADVMPHVEEQIDLLLEAGRSAKAAAALLKLDRKDDLDIEWQDEVLAEETTGSETEFRLLHPPVKLDSLVVYVDGAPITSYSIDLDAGIINPTAGIPAGKRITASYVQLKAEFNMLEIIKADKFDRLRGHPWIVRGLTQMLRRRWMHLALGAGLFATGLQGVPDDALPNGVVASPDLSEGPVIAFRYPVRSWADVKIWDVDFSQHQEHTGVVWMNHATAAEVAGDFDGDYYCFLSAAQFPALANEVRRWHTERTPPEMVKSEARRASDWDELPRVAMEQTNNLIGLITWLTSAAVSSDRLDIADSLAPQAQVAVDRFKFAVAHDWDVIRKAGQEVEPPGWLKDRNSQVAFIERPMNVDECNDTISVIARRVASAWESPKLRCRPLQEFVPLFPRRKEHIAAARRSNQRWGKRIAEAIETGNLDEVMPELLAVLRDWVETVEDKDAWAAALWRVAHSSKHPEATASLPFHAFPDIVADQLQGPPRPPQVIAIVGLQHHEWADALPALSGQSELITVVDTVFDDVTRSLVRVAGLTLGLVSSETPCLPGFYARRLVWNESGCVYATA